MSRSSLARRLLASSLLWIALLLLAGGAGLSYAFRRSAESAFDVRLEAWLHALVAALLAATGDDHAGPGPGDAVAERPAQDARAADNDGNLVVEAEEVV